MKPWLTIIVGICLLLILWECECEYEPNFGWFELRAAWLMPDPWHVAGFRMFWFDEPFCEVDESRLPEQGVLVVSVRSCDVCANCTDYTPWYAWGRR